MVLDQDLSVLRTAQRGLHQPGLTHLTVSSEECRVLNLQRNLERYLGIEPVGARHPLSASGSAERGVPCSTS